MKLFGSTNYSNGVMFVTITASATSPIAIQSGIPTAGLSKNGWNSRPNALTNFISLCPFKLARWNRTARALVGPCRAPSISMSAHCVRVRFAVPLAGSPLGEHRRFGRIQGAASSAKRWVISYSGTLACLSVSKPCQRIADGWRSLQNLTHLGHSLEGFTNGLFDRYMRLDNGFHPVSPLVGGMIKRGGDSGVSPSRTRGFRQRNCCPNPDFHKTNVGSSGGFPTLKCEALS